MKKSSFLVGIIIGMLVAVVPEVYAGSPLEAFRCNTKDGKAHYSSDCAGVEKRAQKQKEQKQKKK